MSLFKCKTKTDAFRLAAFFAFHLFNLVTLVVFAVKWAQGTGTPTQVLYCVLTALYCSIPDIAQRLCKFRIATPAYIVILFYALSPMLGHTYGLYYSVKWWDKFLHIEAGIIFAMFGAYLPKLFLKNEDCDPWLCLLCGLAVSIAISGLWECVEFFCDTFFHTDMQKDTIVYRIDSYLLNDRLGGELGTLLNVENVEGALINGDMAINGYLDIGKTDTMLDMLVELVGAAAYSVVYAIDKGKRFAFHYLPREEKQQEDKV